MHFIYEEGGEIKGATSIGAYIAGAENYAAQTQFGKRIKLKTKDIWLSWSSQELEKTLHEAHELAAQIDIDFLWECAPDEEFKFEHVAQDYYGAGIQVTQIIALAMALQNAPMYFRRKGRGQFLRAPQEQLKAALASVERKQKEAALQKDWEEQMLAGQLPDAIAQNTQQLLWQPDKNGIAYKALLAVSQQQGKSTAQVLLQLGAISSPLEIHQGKFLKEYFPKGVEFSADAVISQAAWQKQVALLPASTVQAFSIDDATTTEIDDAFSVTHQSDGSYQIGVHIAVPGLAITPGDILDQVAQKRMSTVYFPGGKITMLPASVIEVFSLAADAARPSISLYINVLPNGEINPEIPPQTLIENVFIARNLRLGEIEHLVNEESIDDPSRSDIAYQKELSILWSGAQHLHAQRQKVRIAQGQREEKLGPPEPGSLPRDFNFEIQAADGQTLSAQTLLQGGVNDEAWRPIITSRQRGSVIDTIVAEWMIFTNQTWGSMLAQNDLPAIYRAQQGWGAQRTRMQTTPCRHEGLGVENYAWCTSPLRRYSDLVNQWQLLAYVRQGVMAKLVAPFVAKDTKIMGLCAEFDTTYTAYNAYQNIAEKYWCLRYLQTQGLPWSGYVRVQKEGMVRVEPIPLRLHVPELQNTPRGARVEIEVISIDLLELTASVRVIHILDNPSVSLDSDLVEEAIEPILEPEIVPVVEPVPDDHHDNTSS